VRPFAFAALVWGWAAALAAAPPATPAPAPPPALHGLALDETLSGEAITAEALNQALLRGSDLPLYARIAVQRADFEGEEAHRFDRLDERLERYRLKGVPVLLVLADPLPSPDAAPPWAAVVRALADHCRGRIRAYQLAALGPPAGSARDVGYVLKLAAVQLRSADPDAVFAIGPLGEGDVAWLQSLYGEDVAAYVDVVAVAGAPDAEGALRALQPIVEREDPEATLLVAGVSLAGDADAVARGFLTWQLTHLGGKVSVTSYAAEVATVAKALAAAARLKDVLTADVVPLDEKVAGLKLVMGTEDITARTPHTLLYNLGDYNTYLAYGPAPGQTGALNVQVNDPTGLKPSVRDPIGGKPDSGRRNEWDATGHVARVVVPLLDRPLLLQLTYGGDTARASRTEVTGSTLPSVGEIVFRHQQAQAAQDALLQTYTADVRMETHFRPNATDPGFDVITENIFFSSKDGSEWEETTFSLNGTKWGKKRPPFPMLQPEKVLSLPLDLRLSKDYRYRLDGVDKVEGRDAYAVRFDPLDDSRSLYRGTVWIDTKTWAKLKVQAVETRLSPPVVSNEEIQFFAQQAEVGGVPVYLLSHFTTRQIILIAGRNLQVERLARFSGFAVNAADFEEKRTASRTGDNAMYRDTDQGLRHYVKKGGTRVVVDKATTTATALAAGVIVDPSYDFPLPIVGINHLNFNFLGKDNQLAVLFGGVLVLGNVQRPKALGSKIDASVDLFAIAVPSNDQVFDSAGERKDQRLRNHPFSTGLNLGWQLSPFEKLTGSYQFRFDAFARADDTAPDFKPPVDTVTNGFGLGYELRRGGYVFQSTATFFRRGSWAPWGMPGDYDPADRSYYKYSFSLTKDFFFNAVHKVHLNAAYFGGKRLDRFSEYQFGLFEENRIHGVPSSGVRLGELGMLRAGYSFNLFDIYGLDLFVDQAFGREGEDRWRSFTGLGLGFNFRGPWGTLLRGELGKSFLPASYNGAGSFVARITVLKPL
jgi:hypothetical protein